MWRGAAYRMPPLGIGGRENNVDNGSRLCPSEHREPPSSAASYLRFWYLWRICGVFAVCDWIERSSTMPTATRQHARSPTDCTQPTSMPDCVANKSELPVGHPLCNCKSCTTSDVWIRKGLGRDTSSRSTLHLGEGIVPAPHCRIEGWKLAHGLTFGESPQMLLW
jgi:hypothetical protein